MSFIFIYVNARILPPQADPGKAVMTRPGLIQSADMITVTVFLFNIYNLYDLICTSPHETHWEHMYLKKCEHRVLKLTDNSIIKTFPQT